MEAELMEYMKKFSLLDFIGFGRILEVEETLELEDYVFKIIGAFQQKKRKTRKELLRLAKEISEENEKEKRSAAEPKNLEVEEKISNF